MIIAAVGMPGSGKSVFCDHLMARGIPVVYFGGLVLDEVARRGLDRTPETEQRVREDLRAQYGMAAMARLALPQVQRLAADRAHVGIDGLYSFSEYKVLREAFGARLVVIAIVAPRALRYGRLGERQIRAMSPEQALARDLAEVENLEKGGPIALADFYIYNDGDMSAFEGMIDRVLDQALVVGPAPETGGADARA